MGVWQHGLCGCFENCDLCILAFFCPCIVMGKTAKKVGDSFCCCCLSYFIPIVNVFSLVFIRGQVRAANEIGGSCCDDLIWTVLCNFCALVQAAQEMKGGAVEPAPTTPKTSATTVVIVRD